MVEEGSHQGAVALHCTVATTQPCSVFSSPREPVAGIQKLFGARITWGWCKVSSAAALTIDCDVSGRAVALWTSQRTGEHPPPPRSWLYWMYRRQGYTQQAVKTSGFHAILYLCDSRKFVEPFKFSFRSGVENCVRSSDFDWTQQKLLSTCQIPGGCVRACARALRFLTIATAVGGKHTCPVQNLRLIFFLLVVICVLFRYNKPTPQNTALGFVGF
jgi:hypothetical protein